MMLLRYEANKGIRVFSISPGYVETPMTEKEKGEAPVEYPTEEIMIG